MSWSNKYKRSISCDNPSGFSQKAHCAARKKRAKGEETKSKSPFSEMNDPRIPKKPGQPDKSDKHSDLYTDEDPKGTIHGLGFKDVATAKESVSKIRNSGRSHAHKIQAAIAMEQRARVMGKTSEAAIFRKFINSMKRKTEEMNEEKKRNRCKQGNYYCYTDKKCKPIPVGYVIGRDGMLDKEDNSEKNGSNGNGNGNGSSISEEGLRDWFGKSKSKDGKGGWVNVVTGGTCASDEPGEGTPKCVSSAKRASMTKAERLSAARRKKAADPGQQAKTGAASPTYVSTDSPSKKRRKRKTRKEETDLVGLIEKKLCNHTKKGTYCPCHGNEECPTVSNTRDHEYSMARSELSTIIGAAKRLRKKMAKGEGNVEAWVQSKITKAADYIDTAADYVDSGEMNEESDRKGKGSGTKDACYHKVKSRYSVWPSAYASGALVKCRKVGAANWGNKSEAYVLSNWRDDLFPTEGEQLSENPIKNIQDKIKRVKGDTIKRLTGLGGYTARSARVNDTFTKGVDQGTDNPQFNTNSYEPEGEQLDEFVGLLARLASKGIMKVAKPVGKAILRSVDNQIAKSTASAASRSVKPLKSGGAKVTYKPTTAKPSTVKYGGYSDAPKPPSPSTPATRSQAQKAIDDDPWTRGAFSRDDIMRVRQDRRALNNSYEPEGEVLDEKCWPGYKKKGMKTMFGKRYPNCVKKEGFSNWRSELQMPELLEDWQKVNRKDKTDGLSQKAVNAYRRENPGSKLQTAVTEKKPTGKRAKRRSNFCSRMKGMKSKLTSAETARDPDSRINKALRRWNCN